MVSIIRQLSLLPTIRKMIGQQQNSGSIIFHSSQRLAALPHLAQLWSLLHHNFWSTQPDAQESKSSQQCASKSQVNTLLLLLSNDCVQGSNSFFTSKMRKICKNVNKHKMTSNLHTFIKQKFSPRWHATPNVQNAKTNYAKEFVYMCCNMHCGYN